MEFSPDIFVATAEGFKIVIQAKTRVRDLQRTEAQLKEYMVGMQIPVGILATPETIWLYRDAFTGRSPKSVQRVGEYRTAAFWPYTPRQDAEFEAFVQHWLEDLKIGTPSEVPADLREALREYVLPAVTSGSVRAAHPRTS